MDLENAKWITAPADMGQAGPLFTKEFFCETGAAKAVMRVSAVGLYKLFVNGTAYSFGLFNSYPHRIQYQTYDVTESIRPGKNRLEILAAGGWATANMLVRPLTLFCGKVLTYPQFLL